MFRRWRDRSAAARSATVSFIGAVGLPNRYGGFEAFLEHCAPELADRVRRVIVTCDRNAYAGEDGPYRGVERRFISVRANGAMSILHDLFAYLSVYRESTHIVVLGVSGGIWFPFFALLAKLGGKTLGINIDGVEWQRGKFSRWRKALLYVFDHLAQRCSDAVVYDNSALERFVIARAKARATMIPYSGDHVLRLVDHTPRSGALTVCRIEPENNIAMLIEGALATPLKRYTIIGNWNNSSYGNDLRQRYAGETRLQLVDPVYDQEVLARYRESCAVYLHGHSVGGTNPSLVEMLFYDCRILCLDVPYHRATAGDCAQYFADETQLAALLDDIDAIPLGDRAMQRHRYTRRAIVDQYMAAIGIVPDAAN